MRMAELHCHTIYSAMDGTSTSLDYMKRAKELGITHIAQTDHGTHSGHREHQRAAKETGIIPILGEEGYFTTDRFDRTTAAKRQDGDQIYNHITLLSQNEKGLTNLRKMNEIAWAEGYYHKGRIDIEVLEEYNEGVVVLSGCLSGVLAKAIEHNLPAYADQMASEFKRIFGERYFIELMSHNPLEINKGLIEIANKHGFKYVVTSDCHHARKEDLWVQEAMLILSTSPKSIKDIDFNKSQKMEMLERYNYLYPDRKMSFQDFNLHLNSVEEHLAGLERHGIGVEAIENTMIVANMIDSESYPYYEGLDLLPKMFADVDVALEKKVFEGLERLGVIDNQDYVKRAHRELSVIKSKGFSTYFLIADDLVSYAKGRGIKVGPGRGSGAGSLVCYALDLTLIDPLEHNLVFERFIDPSRPDWPDLDLDFEDARREEVKEYARRKYKHVASIATFGFFKDKGTIRDAARVFKIPVGEVNKALKRINDFEEYKTSPHSEEFRKKYPEVERLTEALQGNIKTTGMHAGGIVVSNRPLSDIVPVQTAAIPKNPSAPRVPVVAADMNEIADIGLIKFDILGLKALTILKETCELISKRHGRDIDLMKIPMDDKEVYKMLSRGETKGVFQCSAAPYTRMLIEMGGLDTFDELVVSNALVRPGAADSSFGANYIKAKNGGDYSFIHPDTEWFTRETYGQIIYQEQQMFLCTDLAGMSMEEANKVRKAIGKKKPEELAKWKPRFIEGVSQKIPEKLAENLWVDLEKAANYSFNKSHAVAYSTISYQTAWLKVHYPLEFIVACLNSESDKDEVMNYLIEAKRLGLRILLPNVNKSGLHFAIQKDEKGEFIRMGLSSIKFISEKIGERIISHRPFTSYGHLQEVVMTKGSGLNTRVLQALNAIGGATFPDNPKRGDESNNYYEYLNLPAFKTDLPMSMKMQFRPLDEYSENDAFVSMGMVRKIATGPGWARVEMVDESGTAAAFTDENSTIEVGQMYVFLIASNRIARYISVDDLANDEGGNFQEFLEASSFNIPEDSLRVVSFSMRLTKARKRMGNVVFCDADKNLIPALLFPGNFMQCFAKLTEGKIVKASLKETSDGAIFVDKIA